jgi:Zn-dependent protease/CBS domain-containing protein
MSSTGNAIGSTRRTSRSRHSSRGEGGWMGTSFSLGRVAGVEIGLSWSWLLIFGLIVIYLAGELFPSTNEGLATGTYVAMGVVAAVLFFTSILLHELGHAIQARHEGMEISGITLWMLGGVARFTGMFPSPGAEFRIAVAGPLVTLVIGATLVLAGHYVALPAAVDGVVVWLGLINLFLLGFNLLPAFPMDGGRVLRSALWKLRGDVTWATEMAGVVSRVLGALMIAVGVLTLFAYVGGLWLIVIGWFVMSAGTAEAQLVEAREALAGLRVADAMARNPVTIDPDVTLQDFYERVFSEQRHDLYPVTESGVVVGLLAASDVGAVPPARWQSERVSDLMQPVEQDDFVDEREDLGEVSTKLLQSGLRRALVLRDSRLTGLLSLSDIQRLIELRRGWRPLMHRERLEDAQPRHG